MTSVLPTLPTPPPPSFVRKPASWTFCADFYPKRCSDIVGGVFYELSAKTAKEFSWPFALTFSSRSSAFGSLWAMIWSASMESSHSHEAETQCLLKSRLESLTRLKSHEGNCVGRRETEWTLKYEQQQQEKSDSPLES